MKKAFKSILAVALCCIMLLGTIAIGGDGFAEILDAFMLKVSAATIGSYSKDDIVEFGWYPQTKETDAGIISALNSSGSQWYSYEYYSGSGSWSDGKMVPSDYMRYTDVMYGGNKYRGVVFDSYRPYCTGYTSSSNEQSSNGYYTNTVYWFKYEPIKWRVLDPSTGMVMSEMILDSQAYNNFILSSGSDEYGNTAYWGDAAKTYYANNYEKSSIREWLNNDFYNTAFSPKQQNVINFTTLDNSACPTSYSAYDSASTSDKIYLLSWNDALNSNYGFSTSYSTYDTKRRAQGSDYAKSQGLWVSTSSSYYGNSYWRLRSAGYYSVDACHVSDDGYVCGDYCGTDYSNSGVRPALNFNLKSGIFQCDVSETGTGMSCKVGDYIYFGSYPQSEVKDEELISALNSLGGEWITFNYRDKPDDSNGLVCLVSPNYMRYKDVSYNGNKYRAIIFNCWTEDTDSPSYSIYQEENGYKRDYQCLPSNN